MKDEIKILITIILINIIVYVTLLGVGVKYMKPVYDNNKELRKELEELKKPGQSRGDCQTIHLLS